MYFIIDAGDTGLPLNAPISAMEITIANAKIKRRSAAGEVREDGSPLQEVQEIRCRPVMPVRFCVSPRNGPIDKIERRLACLV